MGGDGQEKIRENNGMDRLGISFEEAVLQRYGKAAHGGRSWSLRSGQLRQFSIASHSGRDLGERLWLRRSFEVREIGRYRPGSRLRQWQGAATSCLR